MLRPLAALAVTACGSAPPPTTPPAASQRLAPACDPSHFHAAHDSPYHARLAPDGPPLHVADRDDATVELGADADDAFVMTRVPIATLAPSVIGETSVYPAPDAARGWPLTVEPGFPITDPTPRAGYVRARSTRFVIFDGWIPADFIGPIWRDDDAIALPHGRDYFIGYDARAEPDAALAVFARVDTEARTTVADTDRPAAGNANAWARVSARGAWVRLDGWTHGPFAMPPRHDVDDNHIPIDDPRRGPVTLPEDTCLYATPELSGAPLGIVTRRDIHVDVISYDTVRVRVDAPWGTVDAYAGIATGPRRSQRLPTTE